ncbi:MAG: hypothetical protein NTZ10_00365 [Candidatus Saganbacteria bacterium]|nr:hypothetical protein [Candidatus Saganbacteria bacterium]
MKAWLFKKKITAFIFCALFLTMIVTGCGQIVSTTSEGREYFPNTDGFSWTYRSLSSATTEVSILRTGFDGFSTVGSQIVQKQKNETFRGSLIETSESLVRVTDSDVKDYGSPDYVKTQPSNMLVFPLFVGASWYTDGTIETTVVNKEDVTTPAANYTNCFKLRTINPSSARIVTVDMWLAKNVGVVKILINLDIGTATLITTIELTSKNF